MKLMPTPKRRKLTLLVLQQDQQGNKKPLQQLELLEGIRSPKRTKRRGLGMMRRRWLTLRSIGQGPGSFRLKQRIEETRGRRRGCGLTGKYSKITLEWCKDLGNRWICSSGSRCKCWWSWAGPISNRKVRLVCIHRCKASCLPSLLLRIHHALVRRRWEAGAYSQVLKEEAGLTTSTIYVR